MDYIKEGERQLNDTYIDTDGETKNYYKKVDPKEVDRQFANVKSVLKEGLQKGYLSKKEFDTLLPPKPKASKLYLLPKIPQMQTNSVRIRLQHWKDKLVLW